MSRFVQVTINGRSLVTINFGECHSFGKDEQIITGFISALHSFAQTISGQNADALQLGHLKFLIQHHGGLIFVLTAEANDDLDHAPSLQKIVEVFVDVYSDTLSELSEATDVDVFKDFGKILIDRGIAENNCGKTDDCSDCENRDRSLPLDRYVQNLRSK